MSRLILHCCLQGLLLLALLSNVSESTVRVYYTYRYSYTYTSYTGSTYYYSIGRIVGGVLGALSFLAFIIGIIIFVCCLRRRRALQAQRASTMQVSMAANGAPITTVSGDPYLAYPKHDGTGYVASQPPPPYQEGMAPGIGYLGQTQQPPYPHQQTQQPPYPQQQQQQPPPYPQQQQQPPYQTSTATHEAQRF